MASYHRELSEDEDVELLERYERDQESVSVAEIGSAIDEAEDTYGGLVNSGLEWVRWLGQYAKLTHWMLVDSWNGEYRVSSRVVFGLGAALVYFVVPTDLIPDLIPIAGWVDDAAVMSFAAATFDDSLEAYVEEREIDPEDFDAIYEAPETA